MGVDIHIKATREITINATGKIDEQYYYIDIIAPKSLNHCLYDIVYCPDPYTAYCKYIREIDAEFEWEPEPVYSWDLEYNKETYDLMVECNINEDCDKHIVGYKSQAQSIIDSLDIEIKKAVDNSYILRWEAW